MSQPVEGGVAAVVTELAAAQRREGFRVVVACPAGGTLSRTAAEAGAEVERWAARRGPGPSVAAETWQARRLIARVAPHLVHAHSAKAGLAVRLALRGGLPTVYQPHAWSFEAVEGYASRLALRWERYAAARWTDRVLCVSEAERRTGAQAGIATSWTVLRNGVDWRRFSAAPLPQPADSAQLACARAALRELREVPAGAPLVVCVGRLCPQKGQRTLLRAWPQITRSVPGAWLVLVGDGPDRQVLAQQTPEQVLFAGAADDVRPWYAAADLAVQPSLWEGMALTPLEAMASGRPVIVTDVDGARESLAPGQEDVCLVPPGDPEALAAAVTTLLHDPGLRAHLGEAARKHVRADFDVRQTASAVHRLHLELLGACPPSGRGRTAP